MCMQHSNAPDQHKAEGFAERLLDVMNSGALTLMVSIGHRTGLFDAMAGQPPMTSEALARKAKLNERYVREWLGAMTTGCVVRCDPDGPRYTLPAEHAAFLARQAGSDNIAVVAQYIPVLAAVEDQVVDCFHNGGGVPYASYGRFHDVMAEESQLTAVSALTDHILPLVPGMLEALEQGIQVLDVGCGAGRAMNHLAQTFPRSRFTGFDLSEQAIGMARAKAKQDGNNNVRFEVRDLSTFNQDAPREQYDLVTAFDAIHDQARPDHVLAGIARALRPKGVFLMQDIAGSSMHHENMDHPLGALMYTISCMHCMTVSLAQGGMGLGAMWGIEKALEMLAEAGFADVKTNRLDHDIQNVYYVCRREL